MNDSHGFRFSYIKNLFASKRLYFFPAGVDATPSSLKTDSLADVEGARGGGRVGIAFVFWSQSKNQCVGPRSWLKHNTRFDDLEARGTHPSKSRSEI